MDLSPRQVFQKFSFRMVKDLPFYGGVLIRLEDVGEDTSILKAAATPKKISYNPEFMATLTEGEQMFVLAHELLHIVLMHVEQFVKDNRFVGNVAGDLLINAFLYYDEEFSKIGVRTPDMALLVQPAYCVKHTTRQLYNELIPQWEAMSPEERLHPKFTINGEPFTVDASQDLDIVWDYWDSLSEEEKASCKEEVKDLILSSRMFGLAAGGIGREIEEVLGTKVQWYNYVKRFLTSYLSDECSFSSPDKNYLWQDIIVPGRCEEDNALEEAIFAMDLSGSISAEEAGEFLFHVRDFCQEFNLTGRVIFWDTTVHEDFDVMDVKEFNPKVNAGGGTDFSCVIDYIAGKRYHPSLLIALTDGEFSDNFQRQRFPMLFVLNSDTDWLQKYGRVCYI